MHNRFFLFAIGSEVMGNGWGLTQTKEETRSIPGCYVRETDYLLKSWGIISIYFAKRGIHKYY